LDIACNIITNYSSSNLSNYATEKHKKKVQNKKQTKIFLEFAI